jgi:alpha-amylase
LSSESTGVKPLLNELTASLLSCKQSTVMAEQSISVSYADSGYGGMPYLFMSTTDATALGLCGLGTTTAAVTGGSSGGSTKSNTGGSSSSGSTSSAALNSVSPHPAVVGAGVLVLVAAGALGRFFA